MMIARHRRRRRRPRSAPRGDDRRRAVRDPRAQVPRSFKNARPRRRRRGRRRVRARRGDRAAIWKNGSKKVEQLLAGPPVSDSLIAVALPSVAVGAPLALGQRFLPPLPKRGMWLAWAVLPAVYEMYIVRRALRHVPGRRGGPGGPEGTVFILLA